MNSKLTFFRYGIDRIVEDMIQEAMARGEFDNLSNAGKPLQNQNYNPYVDTVTHKLNEVPYRIYTIDKCRMLFTVSLL